MRRGPRDARALLFHWRKLCLLGITALVLLAGDAALLQFGPPEFVASLVHAWKTANMPAVATGASFSVSAGSFPTEAKAATFAAALDASGLPIIVRARPDDGRFQVLVGPYISTEEAEHAQRKLAAWGLGEARLIVDDTMRGSPQRAAIFGIGGSTSTGVVMVAAAGMSSVVFEMAKPPRAVEAKRTGPTTLDVVIGKGDEQIADGAQQLSLPDGVSLVRELSIATGESGDRMRAQLVVPEGVQTRLRLEGPRVYVDLAWPKAPWTIRTRTLPSTQAASAPAVESPEAPAASTYQDEVHAAVVRFGEIEPFLMSAAAAPDTDVLAALGHSVDAVHDSVAGLAVPPEFEPNRQSMLAAIARASAALAPSFIGDRPAALREAVAMFNANSK